MTDFTLLCWKKGAMMVLWEVRVNVGQRHQVLKKVEETTERMLDFSCLEAPK